ncbi:hypothetical protein MUB42_07155 (plasmid) [Apilactobacillus kunkeei]|nr:hypothetical protein MUB42_07155 [Apilactobacillus kunkeei]
MTEFNELIYLTLAIEEVVLSLSLEFLLFLIVMYVSSYTTRLKINWYLYKRFFMLSADNKKMHKVIMHLKLKVYKDELKVIAYRKYVHMDDYEDFDKLVSKIPGILEHFFKYYFKDKKTKDNFILMFTAKR